MSSEDLIFSENLRLATKDNWMENWVAFLKDPIPEGKCVAVRFVTKKSWWDDGLSIRFGVATWEHPLTERLGDSPHSFAYLRFYGQSATNSIETDYAPETKHPKTVQDEEVTLIIDTIKGHLRVYLGDTHLGEFAKDSWLKSGDYFPAVSLYYQNDSVQVLPT